MIVKRFLIFVFALVLILPWSAHAGLFSFLMSSKFLPHQFCYLAQPGLVWTNAVTDGLIAVSYLAIFGGLFWLAEKLRPLADIRSYLWIFLAFGTFIVACGLTHVMEIVTVWWPVYRLSAAVKVVCAAASVPTAILFLRAAPALAANMERFVVMLSTTQQEKERALSSLIAAEKLAVAGRISASIAHEIKNPLETVGNLLYLLRAEPATTPAMEAMIGMAATEIARAEEISRSTLSLYRESTEPAEVMLGLLVASVIDLQGTEMMRRRIVVESRIVAPVPLHGFSGEIRQMLINLMQNAAAAIGQDGRIVVRAGLRRGGYTITVGDSGPGIDAANRARIFSLFFTTKGESGTGIGLWLVRSLVEKHGGRIGFRSRTAAESTRAGTVFTLWLPLGVGQGAGREPLQAMATPR